MSARTRYHEYIITMTTPDGDERYDTVRATSPAAAKRQILRTYEKRGWSASWQPTEITECATR